uniref:Mediator of RNA polymerase II transcription subunit 6 n=1 Tax=Haemonchus placei TaxID=6290 RepID=A0A158QN57_HAEPC
LFHQLQCSLGGKSLKQRMRSQKDGDQPTALRFPGSAGPSWLYIDTLNSRLFRDAVETQYVFRTMNSVYYRTQVGHHIAASLANTEALFEKRLQHYQPLLTTPARKPPEIGKSAEKLWPSSLLPT